MKKIKYLIIVLLLIVGIKNIYAFDKTQKIYDYAQVLTEKEEKKLKTQIDKYINKHSLDMVIITVKHYTHDNLQNYINEFYVKNDFGIESNIDGIILAIDLKTKEKNIGIKTFGLATTIYSEDKIENILNEINEEKNYYDKLNKFIKYSNEYINNNETDDRTIYNVLSSINWLVITIISLIIPIILIIIWLINNNKIKKEESNSHYIKDINISLDIKKEKFMTTNTKKERIK